MVRHRATAACDRAYARWFERWQRKKAMQLADATARKFRRMHGLRGFSNLRRQPQLSPRSQRLLRRRHRFARWRHKAEFRRMLQQADQEAAIGRKVHGVRGLSENAQVAPHRMTEQERRRLHMLRALGYFVLW
eukprot:337428-Prymnesium_polylepis.2